MIDFYERQRFTQWWIWVLLFMIPGLAVLSFAFGDDYSYAEFLVFLLPVATIVLFMLMKLETRINSDCIMFRFFPFQVAWKKIPRQEITKIYVRKYHPIREFGGWGIRYGFKTGRAFNVKGNMGIQLEMFNGELILIGTQKPEEAAQALKRFDFKVIDES